MPTDNHILPGQDGFTLHRSVLVHPELDVWTSQIEAQYRILESARKQHGPGALFRLLPSGQRFVPTASSLSVGAVLSDEDLRAIFVALLRGPAGAWIKDELGDPVECDLDQAWVRRQYAPRNYPPLHAPHGWHQDGALGFDFLSHRDGNFPADALLPMVTCWVALGPCGVDAPGLEIITRRFNGLLTPAQLTDERVHAGFREEKFSRPVMRSGDALLFRGDLLHRTHVTPAMTQDRTSLELRFFPAERLPARLKGDRFIAPG